MNDPNLEKAVRKVLEGFEVGVFNRDTSQDGQPGWAFRLAPYLAALGECMRLVPAAAEKDQEA